MLLHTKRSRRYDFTLAGCGSALLSLDGGWQLQRDREIIRRSVHDSGHSHASGTARPSLDRDDDDTGPILDALFTTGAVLLMP